MQCPICGKNLIRHPMIRVDDWQTDKYICTDCTIDIKHSYQIPEWFTEKDDLDEICSNGIDGDR